MGWKDAKEAGKEAFKQSTDQLKNKKVDISDSAEGAQKVAEKAEKKRKK